MKPEAAFQRAVADYLDVALPADAVWSAIGHGGGGKVRGAQLKGMGVRPGVPDLFVCHGGRVLFIELKAAKGRVSPAQTAFHAALQRAGIRTAVCKDLGGVCMALAVAGIPMRARLAA